MIRPGDVLDVRSGGGGGFGDPAERSAAERARDRRLGFVTEPRGALSHVPHRDRRRRHLHRSGGGRRRRRVDDRQGRLDARRSVARRAWRGWSGWPRRSASSCAALLARDRAHRPRHDGRDQRAARAQGRAGRAADDRGPSRRARDARGAQGRPLRSAPAAAGAAGAARSAPRRARAACAPTAGSRRRSTRPRSPTAIAELDAAEVEAVAVCYLHAYRDPPARAADRRRRCARALPGVYVSLSSRGPAADQGVRAGLHDGRQRLRRPGAGALSDPARGAAGGSGLRRAGPDHPVAWRGRDDRRCGAARGRRGAVGPGRRGRRQPPCGAPDRRSRI